MNIRRISSGHSAAGFVLPSVLVFILVFSIIGLIGTRAAREGQSLVRELEGRFEAERALLGTESRAVFALLTSPPVRGGIDLAAPASEEVPDPFGGLAEAPDGPSFWSAAGGQRRDVTGAVVTYRDASGLVSLNSQQPEEIEALLQGLGIGSDRSRRLAAKLLDYTDEDDRRRFMGAERPAYRLLQRPLPTNSPLRSVLEAYNVAEWAQEGRLWQDRTLLGYTTTQPRAYRVQAETASPQLREILNLDEEGGPGSQEEGVFAVAPLGPSGRARLVLSIDLPVGGENATMTTRRLERAIEIERLPQAPDRPYHRHFLWDEIRTRTSDEPDRPGPPLLSPDS